MAIVTNYEISFLIITRDDRSYGELNRVDEVHMEHNQPI